MSDADSASEHQDLKNENLRGTTVSFGKFLTIDSSKRVPKFDNGSAQAFEAIDNRDRSKKFTALVSNKEELPRWPSVSAYEGIANTSLMRLVGSGVVRWPKTRQQHYVFLYQGGLGDALVKPGQFSSITWRHPDIVNFFIVPLINIIKEMSEKGFVHGAIRGDNIFYAGGDKNKPVILGDCLSSHTHSAQPAVYLPIDKALADPMGRGKGSISDDIYAFGVSLAMFLRRNDELEGLSDRDIVRKKIEFGSYTAIVGAERFQATFVELLRGVLHDDPLVRWGVDEILSWADGSRMNPPALSRRKKANRPLTFKGQKYLYPDTLAMDIQASPQEAMDLIQSEELTNWIDKSFTDKELYDNYAKAMDRNTAIGSVSENKDYMIAQVAMALNPDLPIKYKGHCFTYDGLGGLMAYAMAREQKTNVFSDALLQNLPDHAVSLKPISQAEILTQIKSFDTCRATLRQKSQGHGIERCVYALCSSAPCMSPKFSSFFVYNDNTALLTFEYLAKNGGETALFLDAHCIAFFSVHNMRLMERVLYDLNAPDKNKKIAGNLRFLATLQARTKISSLPSIAAVFLSSLDGVYKLYHNLTLRKKIEEGVKHEAQQGNLAGMSALIDNEVTRKKDQKAFELAKREYKILQKEYNEYNRRLANKQSYGVVNGREAAAVVSWIIATGITVMSVIAFLSGYRMF